MNHREVQSNEIIERYVLHQLGAEERRAFQEHYLSCEDCFAQLQISAPFIAAVRREARLGVLSRPASTAGPVTAWRFAWLKPAFALTGLAAIALAALLGWLLFSQIPELRRELAAEKQAREQLEKERQESLRQSQETLAGERRQLELARGEQARLQNRIEELARNQSLPAGGQEAPAQANVPIVILENTRDSRQPNEMMLPANASHLTLWIEVELNSGFDSFQLQVVDAGRRSIQSLRGLQTNSYGALAANISAKPLQTGKYLVRLQGIKGRQSVPVGEYDLSIRRL
jgi:hypothetical protein